MNVEHIKTNERGMTKLLVSFPITQRRGLAELSIRLGMSQQNLIRSAVARLLEDNRRAPEPPAEPETKPEAEPTRPPQPSPNHTWVTRNGGGYWRARRAKRTS